MKRSLRVSFLWLFLVSPSLVFAQESKDPEPAKTEESPEANIADNLPVSATLKLCSAIGDLFLSNDGNHLYALDLSEGKVYKIDTDSLHIIGEASADDAVAMTLAPNGKTLYIACRHPEPIMFEGKRYKPSSGSGTIHVIATTDMKPTSKFPLECAPVDVAATDKGILAVTTGESLGSVAGILLVDAGKRAVAGSTHRISHDSLVRVHPEQTRLYCGRPGSISCLLLEKEPKADYKVYSAHWDTDYSLTGNFQFTPDGKYLIDVSGAILRIGKTEEADLKYVRKTDQCLAIAMNKGSDLLFASTEKGFLKAYSLADFELRKTVNVKKVCTKLVLNPAKNMLHAFASEVTVPQPGAPATSSRRGPRIGHIVTFSLSEK